MKTKTSPALMLTVSMLVFGTLGLFVRHIPLPSGELALYRAVMATVLLAGYLLATREGFRIRAARKELPLLLLSGAAMGVNWILLFEAYRYTTISVATLSYYFAPVIVTILSPLLFREKLTAKGLICFVLSTVGLVLVIGVTDLGTAHLTGILFGLGAAVLYATVILLNKTIKGVAGIQRTFWQFIAATVVHGLSDVIGALLFPNGPYFLGFTITAVMIGLIYGLCFYKTVNVWRIVIAVLAVQVVCTLCLNTLWLSIL